jgi:hypothetical protein
VLTKKREQVSQKVKMQTEEAEPLYTPAARLKRTEWEKGRNKMPSDHGVAVPSKKIPPDRDGTTRPGEWIKNVRETGR